MYNVHIILKNVTVGKYCFTLFCLQHCHLKCFDNNLARLNAAMSESELPWLCRSLDAGMSLGSDAEQKHSLG